ncbi:exo-alpha-sialidase [Arthrobacter gengyunqii]|uniref:Exo-alpha-sialidase n=1 Tax=Arthrobacter gengyunqii TaxID=2886940 RepID=A0A9X1S743_9MICC|nr:exo-alpha-sialidase [Arthrobacter gengyunqii]MCC3268799.1 exo-alpha-sialidase [Arthrobacter gengyunqii]UOY96183.1 exo-alpha-sialidase [Arthrobacter gengyunqii]
MNEGDTAVLAIGTRKGLWLATSNDRQNWTLSGPHFLMDEVASVAIDTRPEVPRILAGIMNWHWGPCVVHSDDLGRTWSEPEDGAVRFPSDTGEALTRVWQVQPDSAGRPGVVWAGAEPISVWKSTDGGEHFEMNQPFWEHPHRSGWGAGFGGAAAHTVLPSPEDDTVHVAISVAGVYRTDDGGASWMPRNTGISAYFLPDPNPEFGQCVHKVARDAGDPRRLYAQNHHGVYRTDNSGDSWQSIADGLPADFGFVMLAHPTRPDTIWTIPLKADGERIAPDGHLAVYRSTDAGDSWTRLDEGLPDTDFNAVLRDAAAVDSADPAGVYFGTRGGQVFGSADEGNTFSLVAGNLPDVLCVRAGIVPAGSFG